VPDGTRRRPVTRKFFASSFLSCSLALFLYLADLESAERWTYLRMSVYLGVERLLESKSPGSGPIVLDAQEGGPWPPERTTTATATRLLCLALVETILSREMHVVIYGFDPSRRHGAGTMSRCCFRDDSRQHAPAHSTQLLPIPRTTLSGHLLELPPLTQHATNSLWRSFTSFTPHFHFDTYNYLQHRGQLLNIRIAHHVRCF
jgi:hypothetical protein